MFIFYPFNPYKKCTNRTQMFTTLTYGQLQAYWAEVGNEDMGY